MKGEIVNLLNEATFYIDLGMNMDIQAFLKGADHIDQYTVKAEGTAYMINIKLKEFSKKMAKDSFDAFMKFIRHEYWNLYLMHEDLNCYSVKYFTLNEGLSGACFEITYC